MNENDDQGVLATLEPAPSDPEPKVAAHQLTFPAWLTAIAVTLTATLSSVWMAKSASAQAWEYKITSPSDESFQRSVNAEGAEGWEMVTARRATSSSSLIPPSYEIIWKRRAIAKEKQPWDR